MEHDSAATTPEGLRSGYGPWNSPDWWEKQPD